MFEITKKYAEVLGCYGSKKKFSWPFQDMDSVLHFLKNKKNYSSKIQIEESQVANHCQVCCSSSPVKCNLIV